MARFERIDPALAADPVPGLRVYGRSRGGRLAVVRVHAVEGGQVYFGRQLRGLRWWDDAHGWPLGRMGLAAWAESIRSGATLAARVPRVARGEAAHGPQS